MTDRSTPEPSASRLLDDLAETRQFIVDYISVSEEWWVQRKADAIACIDEVAIRLAADPSSAIPVVSAPEVQEQEEDTRVGDTQYAAPLATAAENEPVPSAEQWREWAQFVFLGGGPAAGSDVDLQRKVCSACDDCLIDAFKAGWEAQLDSPSGRDVDAAMRRRWPLMAERQAADAVARTPARTVNGPRATFDTTCVEPHLKVGDLLRTEEPQPSCRLCSREHEADCDLAFATCTCAPPAVLQDISDQQKKDDPRPSPPEVSGGGLDPTAPPTRHFKP